jgi:glycogen operon protein
MHVDGFRFDLASVLGREDGNFKGSASFFDAISQDPVMNRVKLIAEPWDIGTYEVGNFPVDWSEWNGRFRDTLRKFVKGDAGQLRDLGWRVTGSADLYQDDGRRAYNSINFVTCHDGFTLCDLVSYDHKHNEANLEDNRDGSNDNNSWNSGAEGETNDLQIIRRRKQLAKNHICALFFSLGTPMLLGGDEFLRTQSGNNNAYCQDNEISWFDWSLLKEHADIFAFTKRIIAFTKSYNVLQQRQFFQGTDIDDDSVPDISWFGINLELPNWNDPESRTLCYRLDVGDYNLFIVLNAYFNLQPVRTPEPGPQKKWHRAIDTSLPSGQDCLDIGKEILLTPADVYLVNPRSTVVLIAK